MTGRHGGQPEPRHGGQPEPRPYEIYLSAAVTILIWAAVAAYLLTRVRW